MSSRSSRHHASPTPWMPRVRQWLRDHDSGNWLAKAPKDSAQPTERGWKIGLNALDTLQSVGNMIPGVNLVSAPITYIRGFLHAAIGLAGAIEGGAKHDTELVHRSFQLFKGGVQSASLGGVTLAALAVPALWPVALMMNACAAAKNSADIVNYVVE